MFCEKLRKFELIYISWKFRNRKKYKVDSSTITITKWITRFACQRFRGTCQRSSIPGGYMSPNFSPLYFCTSAETRPKKKNHPEPPETRAETNRNPGGDMSAETVNTSAKLTNLQKLGLRHSRGNCQHLRELHEPAETRAATLPRKLSTPQRN